MAIFRRRSRLVLAIVGSFLTWLFEFVLTILLTEGVGWSAPRSYALALVVGLLLLYEYHRLVTFRITRRTRRQFVGFFANYGLGYVANWFLTGALSLLLPYWLAIVVVSISLFFVLYWINKKWIFVRN